jgi:hypothetical protein
MEVKYKTKQTVKVAIIISNNGSGMCYKTLGVTMVIYKYEGDTYDYPFIIQPRVYKEHLEVVES